VVVVEEEEVGSPAAGMEFTDGRALPLHKKRLQQNDAEGADVRVRGEALTAHAAPQWANVSHRLSPARPSRTLPWAGRRRGTGRCSSQRLFASRRD